MSLLLEALKRLETHPWAPENSPPTMPLRAGHDLQRVPPPAEAEPVAAATAAPATSTVDDPPAVPVEADLPGPARSSDGEADALAGLQTVIPAVVELAIGPVDAEPWEVVDAQAQVEQWQSVLSDLDEPDHDPDLAPLGHGVVADQVAPLTTSYENQVQRRLREPRLGSQYRQLAQLLSSQYPSDVPAVIAFLASEHNPHVTDVVAHVATLLAQAGAQPVLMVDGNPAEKGLTQRFELLGQPGLSEGLDRLADWHESLSPTAHRGLHVLPSGAGIPREATSARAAATLVQQFKRRYALTLVDAGSVGLPLAERLAAACDAAYVVVRLGFTPPEEATAAVATLQRRGARVLGCVVTGVPVAA